MSPEKPDSKPSKVIMVVDDDEAVLSFLTISLEEIGYKVIGAKNFTSAFRYLVQGPKVDLILLDIRLPEIDGFQICRRVRSHPDLGSIPILFITAYADRQSISQAMEVGSQGLIEKPLVIDELSTQINHALNGQFTTPGRLKQAS